MPGADRRTSKEKLQKERYTSLISTPAFSMEKPNIVLVFMDNFGWGEPGFNGGGIIRGAPTPELDKLADEGLRLG